ncbi:unnamed protein product [Notodromas monacha]|uniref:Uncharacterized protein n=1 Tax=Notodromas monacha TaxID=399045 RepID=A0A7R9GH31_9CRUS|nr:unnamed protein product [Notodromas monacha]CAG0922340.1 unnamed protein product [Notodromas monacha]
MSSKLEKFYHAFPESGGVLPCGCIGFCSEDDDDGLTRLDLCSRISEADDELVFQRFIVQRGMHALTVLAMSFSDLLLVRMKREALHCRGTDLLLDMKLLLNYRYTKMRNEFAPDVEKRTRARQAYLKSVSREAENALRLMPEMQTHLEGVLKAAEILSTVVPPESVSPVTISDEILSSTTRKALESVRESMANVFAEDMKQSKKIAFFQDLEEETSAAALDLRKKMVKETRVLEALKIVACCLKLRKLERDMEFSEGSLTAMHTKLKISGEKCRIVALYFKNRYISEGRLAASASIQVGNGVTDVPFRLDSRVVETM